MPLKIVKCECGGERATRKNIVKCNSCHLLTCVKCKATSDGEYNTPAGACPKCETPRKGFSSVVKCRKCSMMFCLKCGSSD
ncbi:MAG: hypothetical protein K8823_1519 [Cenarchaeum symbiont of Oopsacas minuta]|nr:hypothetical protein [Cenarchaeum symbiont of Oopsacas minuta]